MTVVVKELIFISHATPEDNHFVTWLSTRLTLMGYSVWSDVTQLFGGEKWWDDIEEAIDKCSAKFIIVITKTALSKPGVKREIELALAAELKHKLSNFIIPVIIDDSGFGGQPYGLSDRNIIPFSTGWGAALGKLVERLTRDSVPISEKKIDLGKALSELHTPILHIESKKDFVLSNWLQLESLPKNLNFYRIPGDVKTWRAYFTSCPYPWFEWGGMLASFAGAEDLKKYLPRHVGINAAPQLEIAAVLEDRYRQHPKFLKGEVFKKINYLIAEGWNKKMESLGLKRYEMAGGKLAWFFPDVEKFNGRQAFANIFGEIKKKQLVGFSPKNNVFWHFAIGIVPQYGSRAKVSLIPHVVFTTDGLNPLRDKAKMHSLRRGFCAMWWNDRWRDLLLAYMYILCGESDSFDLPVGENQAFIFSNKLALFEVEFSLVGLDGDEITSTLDEDFDIEVDVDAELDEIYEGDE